MRVRWRSHPLTWASLVCAFVETSAACRTEGALWSRIAALLHPRSAHALVSTPTSLYALAGTSSSGTPVLPVERFDAATSTWSLETTLPGDGLNATAAVVLGDRILLIGGFNTTTNVPTAQVLAYDLSTHAWVTAESAPESPPPPPLPAPRGGHAAVVLDGKLHVLGGGNSERTLADHAVFDSATRTWGQAAPLPRAEGSPAAVAFGGRLVAIGGRSGGSDFADVDLYDPATDTWSAGPPLPSPRGTAGAVVYDGALFVIGGESQARGECLSEVLRLVNEDGQPWQPSDGSKGQWEPAPPMPTARSFARAAVLGDSIYVVGGSSGPAGRHDTKGLSAVERYGPAAPAPESAPAPTR